MNPGKIITFYSYKGGTGRTMALANVACMLAERSENTRVLMIDWDLEAPGLHRFFYPQISSEEERPGLIDYWIDFENLLEKSGNSFVSQKDSRILGEELNIMDYVSPVASHESGGKEKIPNLFLMKAGKTDDPEYPRRVNRFSWERLFSLSPWCYKAFAEMLSEKFDFVLIDSRTGITDTSGICTMIMPENLVVVFVPNQQSLTGVSGLVMRALDYRKSSDDLRPLVVFPLLSRIEDSEKELHEDWRNRYQSLFEELFEKAYGLPACNLEKYFNSIKIKQMPYYSYGEKISVLRDSREDNFYPAFSYGKFTEALTTIGAPWEYGVEKFDQDLAEFEINNLRDAYLRRVMANSRLILPALGYGNATRMETSLGLSAVYTALKTYGASSVSIPQSEKLSMLQCLHDNPKLVLLGDAGAGKSIFVNFVAMCLAGSMLGSSEANLNTLNHSDPDFSEWTYDLLPVRIQLRNFAPEKLSSDENLTFEDVWSYVERDLNEAGHGEFIYHLKSEVSNVGGFVFFDGLDEVPEKYREKICRAIESFAAFYPACRCLVTSRTSVYRNQALNINGFEEAAIAPFSIKEIRQFINRWSEYVTSLNSQPEVGRENRFVAEYRSKVESEDRFKAFLSDIVKNDRIAQLAKNPLLLTLMAYLCAWTNKDIPDKSELLYDFSVDFLLNRWDKQRLLNEKDQPDILEWNNVDHSEVQSLLGRLAYIAHSKQNELIGVADLPEDTLMANLADLTKSLDVRPRRLIQYLCDRAGLLVLRKDSVYTFKHRTFQEYFAACYLFTLEDCPEKLEGLIHSAPVHWKEVALFVGAKSARQNSALLWRIVDALGSVCEECDLKESCESCDKEEYAAWGLHIASQIIAEADTDKIDRRAKRQIETIKTRIQKMSKSLQHILESGNLPFYERVQAGFGLSVLGDPRFFDESRWHLPNDQLFGFIKIPAGRFIMGSDMGDSDNKPQHEIKLPDFWMAKYPVTVQQFRLFAQEHNISFMESAHTAPIVGVTWHEAIKYAEWLDRKMRNLAKEQIDRDAENLDLWQGLLDEELHVTLPSEAEWEKAARGTDGRLYPWNDTEFDLNYCNVKQTSIEKPTVVGCFPSGISPYGLFDMVGNVWEWTRSIGRVYHDDDDDGSKYKKPETEFMYGYPYTTEDGREKIWEIESISEKRSRITRGGAFDEPAPAHANCYVRFHDRPTHWETHTGFRVCISTFKQYEE